MLLAAEISLIGTGFCFLNNGPQRVSCQKVFKAQYTITIQRAPAGRNVVGILQRMAIKSYNLCQFHNIKLYRKRCHAHHFSA